MVDAKSRAEATPTGEPAGSTEEECAQETRRQAAFSEVVQLGDPFINGEQRLDPERREYQQSRKSRGRAPPVDPFTSEDPETQLDDWLPALQRASKWNKWTKDELLIQLAAGHYKNGVSWIQWIE